MGLFSSIMETCDRIVSHCENNENDALSKLGAGFGIAAVVMACIATYKSERIIEKAKEEVNDIIENEPEDADQNETNKKVTGVIVKSGLKVAGLFAGVGYFEYKSCHYWSKSVESYKLDAIKWSGIAAVAVRELYEYRKRFADKYGKEAEEELYYGLESKTVPVLEDNKYKKKKVQIPSKELKPINHNILCFAPWTSSLYCDEERYDCPGVNEKRIKGAMQTIDIILQTSRTFVNMNNIAYELGIKESKDWYNEGRVFGEGHIEYTTKKVYEMYEGRYMPIYYIEVNTTPFLFERLSNVLPESPVYNER